MQYILMVVVIVCAYGIGWAIRADGHNFIPKPSALFVVLAAFCALFALLLLANDITSTEASVEMLNTCRDIITSS